MRSPLQGAGGGALRFFLAALIIGFVATQIPWSDRVQPLEGDWSVVGEISGDWTADQVTFRAADSVGLPADLPGDFGERLRSGEPVTLSRGDGLQWEPGLVTALSNLRFGAVFGVFAAVLGGFFFGVTRWWRLLSLCGVSTAYKTVARLTMLGMFFNLVVPGLTGGDLVKAGLAAKEHPEGKGLAVMAVGLDRVIGLWTLLMIAFLSSLYMSDELGVLIAPLGLLTIGLTSVFVILGVPRLRGALGSARIINLVPRKLSGAVDALRSMSGRPVEVLLAVVLSVGNHVCIGLAVYSVARGMGDETSFFGCLAATVVASAVSAVPIAPGGWGVGEAAYAAMFALLGAGEAIGFAVSVSYRLCQTLISLICGAALWRRGKSEWADELARAS